MARHMTVGRASCGRALELPLTMTLMYVCVYGCVKENHI